MAAAPAPRGIGILHIRKRDPSEAASESSQARSDEARSERRADVLNAADLYAIKQRVVSLSEAQAKGDVPQFEVILRSRALRRGQGEFSRVLLFL